MMIILKFLKNVSLNPKRKTFLELKYLDFFQEVYLKDLKRIKILCPPFPTNNLYENLKGKDKYVIIPVQIPLFSDIFGEENDEVYLIRPKSLGKKCIILKNFC